jgi:isocitrate dehydrogenase
MVIAWAGESNPLSLSGVMMLEHLGWREAADMIKGACLRVVTSKFVTYDFGESVEFDAVDDQAILSLVRHSGPRAGLPYELAAIQRLLRGLG